MRKILFIALVLNTFLACNPQNKAAKDSVLLNTFRYSNVESLPKISVHRGGKSIKNYPENCLETLEYVSEKINAIYEIDVVKTKDGKLVLMHDNSIDRTTTGTGTISRYNYSELQQFNLVDDFGNTTNFKIPLFSEVLKWAKRTNSILTVDIKRSVPQKEVIKAITNANAEDVCIIITYDLQQAKSAYALAPQLMLSVSARNKKEFEALMNSDIPTQNMIAFTGTRLSDNVLYRALHKEDILTMLGTLGNLDRRAEARGDNLYLQWKQLGIDIIATDRPFAVNKALKD